MTEKKFSQVYQFKVTLKGFRPPGLAEDTGSGKLHFLGPTCGDSGRYGLVRLPSSRV
ncbi:MAG: hypothetical protein QW261_13975 [Candidatus Jordarchaeaceae archaeon]